MDHLTCISLYTTCPFWSSVSVYLRAWGYLALLFLDSTCSWHHTIFFFLLTQFFNQVWCCYFYFSLSTTDLRPLAVNLTYLYVTLLPSFSLSLHYFVTPKIENYHCFKYLVLSFSLTVLFSLLTISSSYTYLLGFFFSCQMSDLYKPLCIELRSVDCSYLCKNLFISHLLFET